MEKPLITIYVPSYNRASLIGDALQSVFSQTYSPLEIIICDDASTDGVVETINELIASYKGPHQVIFSQNEKNLGLIGNINKVFTLAKGELVIINCDDDISEPNRVEVLVARWLEHDKKPFVVYSSFQYIDKNGYFTGWSPVVDDGIVEGSICDFLERQYVLGSTAAYRPEVFSVFGTIKDPACYDDYVFFSRGRLLGDIIAVGKPLLRCRDGGISSSSGTVESLWLKGFRASIASYQQVYKDLDCLRNDPSESESVDELRKFTSNLIRTYEVRIQLICGNFSERLHAFKILSQNPSGQPRVFIFCLALLPRVATRKLVYYYFSIFKKRGH